ncbi:hypothetical protein I317_07521 [Kwoniella heveanensis CBS 569]|uniref:Uncharacterized protein n=1 Tax=Kwoniella heveanensis BCC8398 TaxID=1296120 RepID=A0A1B9H3E2_9TREE|nr:hypothetical protein I316_00018 [Kwoniella heveanensis BCC8398]OCF38694.1 hypothetical protein I317_07521 [Kwoniella heveanensis CBS 569]
MSATTTSQSQPISSASLKELHNDPSSLTIDPSVEAQGKLTLQHREHIALVLDLFQGHGTMSKIVEGFTEDAGYEDPVAYAKNREEVAGQLLHIPTVTSSTNTRKATVTSLTTSIPTTSGTGRAVPDADLIEVDFLHDLSFKLGPTYHLDTTLQIYSTPQGIVRLQDRPGDRIPDNGFAMALRKLNGIVAPKVAGVPQNEKEDAEMALKNQK